MKKLAIVISHPIPYYAPVFELLSKEIELCVFYTLEPKQHYDLGFDATIDWDIPLLNNYHYRFLKNKASKPGSAHFMGIRNPTAIGEISAYKPNYLLIYGWAYHTHLQIMYHFKGKIPILFRGDSTLLHPRHWFKNKLRYCFLCWVYRHVDLVFYVGTNNKKYFQKFGLKPSQLIFVPHAVDNNRFATNTNHKAIRQELGIDDTELVILYAGKLIQIKGIALLIEGFLLAEIPHAHLLIVGSGPLEKALKTQYHHRKNIHFLPFQNQQNMPKIYQACDLFCLPSTNDSWGVSINEAMAAGKAVLVSDRAGAAVDLVTPLNGLIFKSGNLLDFSRKLRRMTEQPSELKLLGYFSKKQINYWSFDIQVKNILKAINHSSNA